MELTRDGGGGVGGGGDPWGPARGYNMLGVQVLLPGSLLGQVFFFHRKQVYTIHVLLQ